MQQPKRVKYRKAQRGHRRGKAANTQQIVPATMAIAAAFQRLLRTGSLLAQSG